MSCRLSRSIRFGSSLCYSSSYCTILGNFLNYFIGIISVGLNLAGSSIKIICLRLILCCAYYDVIQITCHFCFGSDFITLRIGSSGGLCYSYGLTIS